MYNLFSLFFLPTHSQKKKNKSIKKLTHSRSGMASKKQAQSVDQRKLRRGGEREARPREKQRGPDSRVRQDPELGGLESAWTPDSLLFTPAQPNPRHSVSHHQECCGYLILWQQGLTARKGQEKGWKLKK